MRSTPNSPVTCFPRQAIGATPRLTDGVLGPDNLPSPTTDYAYTLAGSSQFGLFETWIQFDFTSNVSLVTLHYYCTGQSPQLRLSDGSDVVTFPVSPPCDSTAQRQCFTFRVSTSTRQVNLELLRNSNTIYLSDVKFFEGQPHNIYQICITVTTEFTTDTDCCTIMTNMPTRTVLTAAPSSKPPGPSKPLSSYSTFITADLIWHNCTDFAYTIYIPASSLEVGECQSSLY